EFRGELARYELGATPLQVAVRIRRHPRMRITAPNKMRWAIDAETSYGGERPQTIYFKHKDKDWLDDNFDTAKALVKAIGGNGTKAFQREGRIVWKDVPLDAVKLFLKSYKFHERSRDLNNDLILDYIAKQNKLNALTKWNVAIVGRAKENTKDAVDFETGI